MIRKTYRSSDSAVREAFRDLLISLENWRLPIYLAWRDLQSQYRRSLLGPIWLTLTLAIRITALGLIFSSIFGLSIRDYLIWLTAGIVAWDFISGTLESSCEWFTSRAGYIKQGQITLGSLVIWGMASQFLIMLHNLPLCFLVCLGLKSTINLNLLYLPLGILMLSCTLIPIGIILGMIVPRLRDIGPLVSSLLQVAFFVTPVMWLPGYKGIPELITRWNPLSHLVSWVRNPLLGEPIDMIDIVVFLGFLLVLIPVSWAVFAGYRRRLAFWL